MHRCKSILAFAFLALWLIGQMPWLLGAVFFLHGPHEVSAVQRDHRVAWILCHQPADAGTADHHHDRVIPLSLDEPANRPGKTGAGSLCLTPLFLAGRDVMPTCAPLTTHLPRASRPDVSPPLRALRTVVLLV